MIRKRKNRGGGEREGREGERGRKKKRLNGCGNKKQHNAKVIIMMICEIDYDSWQTSFLRHE